MEVSGTSIPNPFLLQSARAIRLQEEGAPEEKRQTGLGWVAKAR